MTQWPNNSVTRADAMRSTLRAMRSLELGPDSRGGFPAVTTLSPFEMNLPNHVAAPLDNFLFALGAEGVFSLMAGDVADIDVFKTCRESYISYLLQCRHWGGGKRAKFVEGIEP